MNYRLEKIATRAWKKHWQELSEGTQDALTGSANEGPGSTLAWGAEKTPNYRLQGIQNRAKQIREAPELSSRVKGTAPTTALIERAKLESNNFAKVYGLDKIMGPKKNTNFHEHMLSGLNRGSENIAGKLGVPIGHLDEKAIGKRLMENSPLPDGRIKNFVGNTAGRVYSKGGGNATFLDYSGQPDLINAGNNDKNQFKKSILNTDKNWKDYQAGKRSLTQRFADAIGLRHEVDEARSGVSLKRPARVFSHLSPQVLTRESANVAIAPKETKQQFIKARKSTKETKYIPGYGQKAVEDKNLARKLVGKAQTQNGAFSEAMEHFRDSSRAGGKELVSKLRNSAIPGAEGQAKTLSRMVPIRDLVQKIVSRRA